MKNILIFLFVWISGLAQAQHYKIMGQITNATSDTMYLSYVYGASQYVLDTSIIDNNTITFEGNDTLKSGVYYIVSPPENSYFLLIVNDTQPEMEFSVDLKNPTETISFSNSLDNDLYYKYTRFLEKARQVQTDLNAKYKDQTDILQDSLSALTIRVENFRDEIIKTHPETVTSLLLNMSITPQLDDYQGSKEEIQQKQYAQYKREYFDFIDLSDTRILRTPYLHTKVMDYINTITPQHPDSIAHSMDVVLEKLKGNQIAYQYFLSTFLNEYIQPKVMGMDKVYVHLVDNYYNKGKAPWIDEEQLLKIKDNANFYRGTLIGKIAPELTFKPRGQNPKKLDDISSEYKVLLFWSPTCSYCKSELPKIPETLSKLTERDVQLVTLCTKKEEECWEFIDGKDLNGNWINAQPITPSYYRDYDLRLTPRIFILDRNNEVLFKNISLEQIPNAFEILDKEQNKH